MSITDNCTHRHHHSPKSKQAYRGCYYQLCECLECESRFVQVTYLQGSTYTFHVVAEVENVDLARQWIDSHS